MRIPSIVSIGIFAMIASFTSAAAGIGKPFQQSAISYSPSSLNDLVETSDLIVVGTVGRLLDARLFYGYHEGAAYMEELDRHTPFSLGLPIADFSINVIEVIKDDDTYPTHGESIVWRTMIETDQIFSPAKITDRWGKTLFFLSRNSDNQTYGLYHYMNRIKINSDNSIMYSDNGSTRPVPFASGISPQEFIDMTRQISGNP